MPFDCCGLPGLVPARIEDLDASVRLTLLALAAFSTLWVGAVGAAVGSFLNVVVYRLPRGMSLVRPKSRCPSCGTSIRPGDNIPILGWMRLRGRCRSCRSPISPRYPLVETATALLFLGLAHFELFSGGANLPFERLRETGSLNFVLWSLSPWLIGLTVYHAALASALLCISLIVWDGFPPPRRLMLPAVAFGLFLPVFLPMLHPVLSGLPIVRQPLWMTRLGEMLIGFVPAAFFDPLIGLVVGAATGLLLTAAVGRSRAAAVDRRGTIAAAGLLGLYLGYQAAIGCGLLAAMLSLFSAVVSHFARRPLPVTVLVAMTAAIQVPLWRTLSQAFWWPGPTGWNVLRTVGWPDEGFVVTSLTAAACTAALLAALAGRIVRREQPEAVPSNETVPPADAATDSVTPSV